MGKKAKDDKPDVKLRRLPHAFDGLTRFQQAFVEVLIDNPAITQRQAIIKAGSTMKGASADQYACKLLKIDKVKSYLDHLRAKTQAKVERTAEDAVRELAKIGFSNIQNYITDDNTIVDLSQIPRDDAAAVASISVDIRHDSGDSEGYVEKVKFTTHSKVIALNSFLDRLQGKPRQAVDIRQVVLKRELTDAEVRDLMEDKALVPCDSAIAE